MILDGGTVDIGLESTILDMDCFAAHDPETGSDYGRDVRKSDRSGKRRSDAFK